MKRHLSIRPGLLRIAMLPIALLLAPFSFVAPAHAMCAPAPTRVVTVIVASCQDSLDRWETTRGRPETGEREERDDFYRQGIEDTLHGQPGVVITGTLTRAIEVEGGPDGYTVLGESRLPEREGEWFVASADPAVAQAAHGSPCDAYPEGETVEIYSPPVCCDMLPPQDAACALGVEPGAPVPEALQRALQVER